MPIYEFYCPDCHRIYRFLSRSVDTTRRPDCPRCGHRALERRPSTFAVSRGRKGEGAEGGPAGDDARLEAALAALADEAESLPEDDPRAAARMMRRLFDASGMPVGEGMEEALRRMEAGEDPDEVEEEMGDLLDDLDVSPGEAGAAAPRLARWRRRYLAPSIDETLHEM